MVGVLNILRSSFSNIEINSMLAYFELSEGDDYDMYYMFSKSRPIKLESGMAPLPKFEVFREYSNLPYVIDSSIFSKQMEEMAEQLTSNGCRYIYQITYGSPITLHNLHNGPPFIIYVNVSLFGCTEPIDSELWKGETVILVSSSQLDILGFTNR